MGPILALFIFISIPLGCLSQECVVDKETVQIPENNVEKVVVTNISLGEGYTVEVETHTDKFIIEGSSLVLNVSVDYEVDRYFQVNLVCKQHGNFVATRFVIVQIIDVNDNPPVFKDVLYSHSVSEDQKVNTAIGLFIEATDLDASDIIYYELLGSDVEAVEYFKLSSATNPDILVNKTLDYDLCPRVHMNITARDTQLPGVTPSHTATASIIIDIIDADDKPPFFLPCTPIGTKVCFNTGYTGTVNRSQQATEPLNLEPGPLYAVDGDYGINDVIVYDILSGNEDAVFAVDRSSGNITMSKSIDTVRTINLLVMASQISDASKQTTTTVRIDVKEKNLYPPIFENDNYHGVVSTHSEIETFVMNSNNEKLKVFAADGDFPDKVNPSIEYKIENSTDFAIFSNGYIWTKTVFTSPGTAVILVSATDRITLETTSTLVTVEIIAAPTTVATTTRTSTFTTSHTPWTGSTTSNTGPTGNVNPSTTTKATITGTDDGGSVGALNHFSSGDMAALGASLGAVLIVALAGLGFLIHKQYGDLIRSKFGRSSGDGFGDSEDRTAQLIDDNTNSDQGNDNPDLDGVITEEPSSSNVNLVTAVALGSALLKSSPVDTEPSGTEEKLDDADDDSDDNKVKSILTKEFKEDAGYKAVWFREDAAPEVVVIEGVEEAEADDDDDDDDEAEEDINNQEENDDDDDDEEELDLAFNFLETGSNNVSVL